MPRRQTRWLLRPAVRQVVAIGYFAKIASTCLKALSAAASGDVPFWMTCLLPCLNAGVYQPLFGCCEDKDPFRRHRQPRQTMDLSVFYNNQRSEYFPIWTLSLDRAHRQPGRDIAAQRVEHRDRRQRIDDRQRHHVIPRCLVGIEELLDRHSDRPVPRRGQ
jgi:hypothetical protein